MYEGGSAAMKVDDPHEEGKLAARSAISTGVAGKLLERGDGQDPEFARGVAEEVSRALVAKEITIDFRPWLRTPAQIEASFTKSPTRLLDPARPIDLPRWGVRYEVFLPPPAQGESRFQPPTAPYVRRKDKTGTNWVAAYRGAPIPYVIATDETYVTFRFAAVVQVFHLETGQLLQTIRRTTQQG